MNSKIAKIVDLPDRPMRRYHSDKEESFRPAMVMTTDHKERSSYNRLGLCFFYSEKDPASSYLWMPNKNRVIQTYRALLLLDQCRVTMDDIFCACYHCAGRDTDSVTLERYYSSLRESLVEDPAKARDQVLERPIRQSEINNIFGPIIASKLPVDMTEILAERSIGALQISKGSNLYYLTQKYSAAKAANF